MTDPEHSEDPRTGLLELSVDECWELLGQKRYGRIAVVDGSAPDIFPVNFRIRHHEIVIRTEAGTKLAAATMMSAVAFEIDDVDSDTHHGWSVVVKGHGREPKTVEEVLELEELEMEPWVHTSKSRWLVITPHDVTGRRIP